MQISNTVLNAMLDTEFNDIGETYSLRLFYEGGGLSSTETIDFGGASAGSIQLLASVFFAITSGTTINGLRVFRGATLMIEETFAAPVVYVTNGTFTVNNVTVSVSVTA